MARISMKRFLQRLATYRAANSTFVRYQSWIWRYDRLSIQDKQKILDHLTKVTDAPQFLVVIRIDQFSQQYLRSTLRCLEKQLFEHWKVVLNFDETCSEQIISRVEKRVQKNSRFMIVREGIDDNIRQALEKFCTGDWIVAMACGVLLRPHSLYMFAITAAEAPGTTLIYADEDRLNWAGLRSDPYFKSQFSPELARSVWYIGPCVLIHGLRSEAAATIQRMSHERGATAWVRCMAHARAPGATLRISFILYHDALAPRLREDMTNSAVKPDDAIPSVAIIVPTKDRVELLEPCLESVDALTVYPRSKMEIIVIDNGSADHRTLAFLTAMKSAGKIRVVRDQRPFNYSELNNRAAATTRADVLVLLNNDTEIIDGNWLRRLVEFARQDGIGVVGMKLLYPDRTIQHGGIVLGTEMYCRHAHTGLRSEEPGYHHLANLTHEVCAVTGACLAVRASVFREVGGFDPALRDAFSDVLLCLDVLARGYRNIYIGDSAIIHHESKTRGFDNSSEKFALYLDAAHHASGRHPGPFLDDPYYNPNLSKKEVYDLAFPPRVIKPWHRAVQIIFLTVLEMSVFFGSGIHS